MADGGELRVVLQTGASAGFARIFAVAFTFGSLGAALLIALLTCSGSIEPPLRYVFPLTPVGFVVVSVIAHWVVWRTRATDVLLGPAGLRFEGGPLAGQRIAWADLDVDRCRIETDDTVSVRTNDRTTYLQRLVLSRGGEAVVAATSTDDDEQASLAALLEILRSKQEIIADVGPAEVVRCTACGSAASPADRAEVACWRCGASVPMPGAVRKRLHDAANVDHLRDGVAPRIRALVDQPRARAANAWFLASMLVWYVVPLLMCLASQVWASWGLLAFAVLEMSDLQVARRHAFHRLAVVFAARPGETPGAPLRCRSCAGPLPSSDKLIVQCPWCAADNVRQMVFERPASVWARADQDLNTFADEQRKRTAWPRFAVAASMVAAVGWATWSLLAAFGLVG
jgi:hypothetical protein